MLSIFGDKREKDQQMMNLGRKGSSQCVPLLPFEPLDEPWQMTKVPIKARHRPVLLRDDFVITDENHGGRLSVKDGPTDLHTHWDIIEL